MRFAVWVPNFKEYGDARRLADLAGEAEDAGWDGFFLWDHVYRTRGGGLLPGMPVVDPWIAFAAIACGTERIRFGPMVTPLPRRRPWKLAREVVSLDHLSGGRVILGVGAGSPADYEFEVFGEDPDPRVRARKLDEGLEILAGLWSGERFSYRGEHYRIDDVQFGPPPLQRPRVPIWVGGLWPRRRPFERAARWDGAFPLQKGASPCPGEIAKILDFVGSRRSEPFEMVVTGETEPGRSSDVPAYAGAGATWWLERLIEERGPFDAMRRRVRAGPPR